MRSFDFDISSKDKLSHAW